MSEYTQVMEDMNQDKVQTQYDEVCGQLNLDEEAKENAWKSYKAIYNDYILEGSQLDWLACSLYVACRDSSTHTVEGDTYTGNSINLTQILRATNMKIIEFFCKIKKWFDMAKLPPCYLEKIEALERKFEVISVIFKKYELEFATVFRFHDDNKQATPTGGSSSRPRSRKPTKAKPCTVHQLFQFGWILYIHVKDQFPLINDDLVNSHYLLLCCLNMMCGAAVVNKRRDLLNDDFLAIPTDGSISSPFDDFNGILSELCRQFAAIERECQVVHDYYWWPSVRRLYESQVLAGIGGNNPPELADVLNNLLYPASFHNNFRSLKSAYELAMLQEGDFDERIFLHNETDTEGQSTHHHNNNSIDKDRIQPGIVYQSPQHLQYGTPLTGREYLTHRDNKLTPVSDANQSVIQLHMLLEDCGPTPSEPLINICKSCPIDPLSGIVSRIEQVGGLFLAAFNADSFLSPDNFALLRLRLSQSLYYKLLYSILLDEETKLKHQLSTVKYTSIQLMLEHDHFHKSLFSLCIEIVLFSYNSHSRIFPWVLSVIDINPYHFYKVIEIIIKVETGFPRAVVKHLSKIEELVLSSLAWKESSPLYESLKCVASVPRYEEVALPNVPHPQTTPFLSPLQRLRASREHVASPLSARDRYSSPHPVSRRQLFTNKSNQQVNNNVRGSPFKQPPLLAPKPPQGVVQVTQIKPNYLQEAAAALSTLLQQRQSVVASPQKPHPPQRPLPSSPSTNGTATDNNMTIQALVSLANMKSPLHPPSSSDRLSSSSLPTITLTVSPSQNNKTPQKSVVTTPTSTTPSNTTVSPPKPRKTGSVALFYRKVYQMAFLRIKDLCERLQLDVDTIQKIWTCFEYCMIRSPDIMRERDIDQVIMCSVYIVAKVLRKDVTFQEIMRQYRHQPQAKSHVYRSVLLNNGHYNKTHSHTASDQASGHENESPINKASDVPSVDSRGDIIQFYNKVFIDYVKDFVLQFAPGEDSQGKDLTLSPLPVIKRSTVSPRKISRSHQIFISPLKQCHPSLSPLAKTYVINKSPASDLQELNQVTGGVANRNSCKRKLEALLVCNSPAKKPHLEQRMVGRPQGYTLPQQRNSNGTI